MPHHFQKNTMSASFWCNLCGKDTEHRIDDGRRGPCLNPGHGKRVEKTPEPPIEQLDLLSFTAQPKKDAGGR